MCNNCTTAPIEAPTTGTTPIPTNEGKNAQLDQEILNYN